MQLRPTRGFTLIELMIVVAIIATILAIAVPRFGILVSKSKESSTKGNLGALRGALSVYYGECEGIYPTDNLASLVNDARFIPEMPATHLPPTPLNSGHGGGPITGVLAASIPSGLSDVADNNSGWIYDNVIGDTFYGTVLVNCSHTDVYGDPWTSF